MRILYGIAGEGLGHATRSEVVINHLQKKHDVTVIASQKAYEYLSTKIPVQRIEGLHLRYKDNKVSRVLTILENVAKLPRALTYNWKHTKNLCFDVVISDFESWSWFLAKLRRKPMFTLDNNHTVTRTFADKLPQRLLARLLVPLRCPFANHYFITSFFKVKPKKKTSILPPILREEILECKPVQGKHFLVYQTASSNQQLLEKVFTRFPKEQFIIFGKGKKHDNISYCDGKDFVQHLASSKAVITNGGFTLISEALHLGKPVLSLPFERQYEQGLNAHYVAKEGFGRGTSVFTVKVLHSFLRRLPKYRKALKHYTKKANDFTLLERALQKTKSSTHR